MLGFPMDLPTVFYPASESKKDLKLKDWIVQIDGSDKKVLNREWDVILFGVPLSRSSISVSGASEFPEHFRRAWKIFSTYNLDYEVDLKQLSIVDIGDVQMHFTDIPRCHSNIVKAMKGVKTTFPSALPVAIGGDHSVTAMLVSGIKEVFPENSIGILQFDTHLDLRDLSEHGPTNGTPIRYLIENGILEGSNVYNIGLHGFFNSQSLIEYAKEKGVNYCTLREARRKGLIETVREAIKELESKVDHIYVTIDMDVLDIAFAPGVPASTPGGMTTAELFDAVFEASQTSKLAGMDIVCLDPTRDTAALPTVKAGVSTFLNFATGHMLKKKF